jgi:hypothetical protein
MAPDINPSPTRQVFMSKDMRHRIVRVGRSERLGLTADQLIENWPALAYQFEDGYLVIDDRVRERDRRFFEEYGEKIGLTKGPDGRWEDFGGKFRPDQPAEEWLREHRYFNASPGFVEVGYQAPDSGPVLALVADAVLAEDTEKLIGLYEAEEQSHNRPDVLERIKTAIETLDARREQREVELAAAAEGAGAAS